MTKYACPVCHKRICDSEKALSLTQTSAQTTPSADVVIKCRNCKNTISIQVSGAMEYLMTQERAAL